MMQKILVVSIVLLAIILGAAAVAWPTHRVADIVYVSRFFDVMLPVLAVGALIKYLISPVKK